MRGPGCSRPTALVGDDAPPVHIEGFRFAAGAAGIKKRGGPDVALMVCDGPRPVAAGLFTTSRVTAAPVRLSLRHLEATGGEGICAIVANSGNANACTGRAGDEAAERMAEAAARTAGVGMRSVLVASTGVIGAPMDAQKAEAGIERLGGALTAEGLRAAAEAIRTTDTFTKIAVASGGGVHVAGIAKGAGMIRPDVATMLAFVFTDAAVDAEALRAATERAAAASFNRISVDGAMSTNDTLVVMASGAGATAGEGALDGPLTEVCRALAWAVVKDGEGATRVVEVWVTGARSVADAERAARFVADSPLVKTAVAAGDANWGRVFGATGASGVEQAPERLCLWFDDVMIAHHGTGCGPEAEARATAVMARPGYVIRVDLGVGEAEASVLTCDLTADYVRINADYRT
jgi:glutamate N-acetyltransferase/amino-acid N-acetyltransferase